MQARALKKLLDTQYFVHKKGSRICVGSPLCNDLLSLDTKAMKLSYALSRDGRGALIETSQSPGNSDLLNCWDTLQQLIDSGKINEFFDGQDMIENPLPVFYINDAGELIETVTDAYGHPNTTAEGVLMFDNTFFKTRGEAIEYGIKDYNSYKEDLKRHSMRIEEDLEKNNVKLESVKQVVFRLTGLL